MSKIQSEMFEVQLQENGLLHFYGYAVVLGLSSHSYGLTKNQLLLSNEDPGGEDHWYPVATLSDPSLNTKIGQNDKIDYSHGAITTLSEAGIDLSTLPPVGIQQDLA